MTPTDELCASFIKRAKKLPKEYQIKLAKQLQQIESQEKAHPGRYLAAVK